MIKSDILFIMRTRQRKEEHPMGETSTLLVHHFPRALRAEVHARAIREQKRLHEVFIELIEKALTTPEKKGGEKRS
jgi:hypothetical protein